MSRCRGLIMLAAIGALIGIAAWTPSARPAFGDDLRGAGASHEFKFQFGDQPLYYTIETEFRDSGGVPPLISYSTAIKDRRSIIQRRNVPNSQPISVPGSSLVSLIWECDRYEAREQGMKEESVYDSLRHQFAPSSLRELEANADSKVAFLLNPKTGDVSSITIMPGMISGAMPRRGSMGKTVEKCSLTQGNMKSMLESMCWLYWPDGAKRAGDVWKRTLIEPQGTFGVMTTIVQSKLASIKKVEGRDVAVIEISADVKLKPNAPPSPPIQQATTRAMPPPVTQPAVVLNATSRPAGPIGAAAATTSKPATTAPAVLVSPPRNPAQREFRLEKGMLSGNVEFDLTRGELIQLSMRRETVFVADVESQGMGKMQLRSGTAQQLQVKSRHTQPPKPVIVGGKVPPKMSEADQEAVANVQQSRKPATQAATTQGISRRPQRILSNPALNKEAVSGARRTNESRSAPRSGGATKRSKPPAPTSRPVGPTSQPLP